MARPQTAHVQSSSSKNKYFDQTDDLTYTEPKGQTPSQLKRLENFGRKNLSQSVALTKAARDLACELGQLALISSDQQNTSIVPATPKPKLDSSNTLRKQQMSEKHVIKYGKGFNIINDIILYSSANVYNLLTQICVNQKYLDTILSNDLLVCGISYSQHNAMTHCIAIVFADQIQEDPSNFTNMQGQQTTLKLQKRDIQFVPTDNSKFIANEQVVDSMTNDEDTGLLMLAKFMISYPPNGLTPIHLLNIVNQSSNNTYGQQSSLLQPNSQINCNNLEQFIKQHHIISEAHILSKVIQRLENSERGKQNRSFTVQKFDRIIKPYLTRIKKQKDIQHILCIIKQNLFQRNMPVRDFYDLCLTINSSSKTLNNKDSIMTLTTSATPQIGVSKQDQTQSQIDINKFRIGLEQIDCCLPLAEFNLVICAFRVTKGRFIATQDFMYVFNKIQLQSSPKKVREATMDVSNYVHDKNKASSIIIASSKFRRRERNSVDEQVNSYLQQSLTNYNTSQNSKRIQKRSDFTSAGSFNNQRDQISKSTINGSDQIKNSNTSNIQGVLIGSKQIRDSNQTLANCLTIEEYIKLKESPYKGNIINTAHQLRKGQINIASGDDLNFQSQIKNLQSSSSNKLLKQYQGDPYETPNVRCTYFDKISPIKACSSKRSNLRPYTSNVPSSAISRRVPECNQLFKDDESTTFEQNTVFNSTIALQKTFQSNLIRPFDDNTELNIDESSSPRTKLNTTKRVVCLLANFKMDTQFNGPLQGYSLGSKVYNGPGMNHNILGEIQRGGIVNAIGRTADRLWTQVQCQSLEGWILSSKIDYNTNRNIYEGVASNDNKKCQLIQHNNKDIKIKQTVYTVSSVVLRKFPKWDSHALLQLSCGIKLHLLTMDEQFKWVEVSYAISDQTPIKGWLPFDSISKSQTIKRSVTKEESPYKTAQQHLGQKTSTPMKHNTNPIITPKDRASIDRSILTPSKREQDEMFRSYNNQQMRNSVNQKYDLREDKISSIKAYAVQRIINLRQQNMTVDLKIQRNKELVTKIANRLVQLPIMKAFRQWQFVTQLEVFKLKQERTRVRQQFIHRSHQTRQNIHAKQQMMLDTNKDIRNIYEQQRILERTTIDKAERQVMGLVQKKVEYQKEKQIHSLGASKSRMYNAKSVEAATVRQQKNEGHDHIQEHRNFRRENMAQQRTQHSALQINKRNRDSYNSLKKSFNTRKTRPIEYRKQQLRQLIKGMDEMNIQLTAAAEKDLGREPFVSQLTSIYPCRWEAKYALDNLDTYVKDIVKDTSLLLAPAKTKIKYEPLGVVLIFGSWNYPYVVTVKPLVQCIAAGDCALIKPSEMAPHCSAVLKTLIDTYLDNDCYKVLEGGVEIASEICKFPWDMICFTGSTMKGKLVAEAAAKNLVPCILELGGKCPCVVDETADVDFAASKVCFARFGNSGQTCVSTDYVLVHESKKQLFIEKIQLKIKQMFGEHPDGSPEMGKMIADFHCDRIQDLIKSSGGNVVCGGKINKAIKYVEPTVIVDPKKDSAIMNEEIFGPVLPIISYDNIQTVIDHINSKDKPLAVYYFGKVMSNGNLNRLLEETSSGQFVVNEVLMQMCNHEFGFGGVGASGYGRYGGYEGFKSFSNPKSVMLKPTMNFHPFNSIHPPFTPQKKAQILKLVATEGTQSGVVKIILLVLAVIAMLILGLYWRSFVYEPSRNACKSIFDL